MSACGSSLPALGHLLCSIVFLYIDSFLLDVLYKKILFKKFPAGVKKLFVKKFQ